MIVDVQNVRENGKKIDIVIYSCFTGKNCISRGFTIYPYPFFKVDDIKEDEIGSEYCTEGKERKAHKEGRRPLGKFGLK